MAYDITNCAGGDCPFKLDCYRHTSEVLGRQDFFGYPPYDAQKNECTYFWDNTVQIQEEAYLIWQKKGRIENQDLENWLQAKEDILQKLK